MRDYQDMLRDLTAFLTRMSLPDGTTLPSQPSVTEMRIFLRSVIAYLATHSGPDIFKANVLYGAVVLQLTYYGKQSEVQFYKEALHECIGRVPNGRAHIDTIQACSGVLEYMRTARPDREAQSDLDICLIKMRTAAIRTLFNWAIGSLNGRSSLGKANFWSQQQLESFGTTQQNVTSFIEEYPTMQEVRFISSVVGALVQVHSSDDMPSSQRLETWQALWTLMMPRFSKTEINMLWPESKRPKEPMLPSRAFELLLVLALEKVEKAILQNDFSLLEYSLWAYISAQDRKVVLEILIQIWRQVSDPLFSREAILIFGNSWREAAPETEGIPESWEKVDLGEKDKVDSCESSQYSLNSPKSSQQFFGLPPPSAFSSYGSQLALDSKTAFASSSLPQVDIEPEYPPPRLPSPDQGREGLPLLVQASQTVSPKEPTLSLAERIFVGVIGIFGGSKPESESSRSSSPLPTLGF